MRSLLIIPRRPHLLAKRRWQSEVSLLQKNRCVGSTRKTSSDAASSKAAADDAIAVDSAVDKTKSTLAAQCVRPRPIFPWRSSPDPLPRLIRPVKPNVNTNATDVDELQKNNAILDEYYGSDYFKKGGPLGPGWINPLEPWFRGALYANVMNLLGVSWPWIIIPWTRKNWAHDMEGSFCNAFSIGVQGMVEDTYMLSQNLASSSKVENTEIGDESESFDVNLDITIDPVPSAEKNNDPEIIDGEVSNKISQDFSEDDEQNSMLQRNLRQLYQSAREHSNPSKVNIVLRTVPQSAQIESMFPVFGLSRSLVDNHPNLRHTYRNLRKGLERRNKEAVLSGRRGLNPLEVGKYAMNSLNEVLERSAKLAGDGNASITLVAQVSINCKEIFCVRDVESGEIIQGHGDAQPRDVTHLVRFEMVIKEKLVAADEPEDGDWEMQIGRWQISDWDDILDGNVFFT
mmetsp:Transcript_3750/g.7876  ORF Transcript_3750/g.7876 Transcript_3750/m.7876 type:complete len:457 (+) Transcript_3750:128-1498(+)